MAWRLIKPILLLLPGPWYRAVRRLLLDLVSRFGYTNSQKRMDRRIVDLFDGKTGGVFIEVGAADGLDQSNTLLLERKFGWSGLLVEPLREPFEHCRRVRRCSIVERYILAAPEDAGSSKIMHRDGLQSAVVNDNENDTPETAETVETTTLDLLLAKHGLRDVDILSLDVEGFEESLLDGYSGENYRIRYLLVEAWDPDRFANYAERRGWRLVEHWGTQDYLYELV